MAGTSTLPNLHLLVGASAKPDPVTVTEVPPDIDPLEGLTAETVGAATYVKIVEVEVKSAPLLLTKMSIAASASEEGGETHTMLLEERKVAETSVEPNLHLRSLEKTKFEPETVTLVPPVEGPTIESTFVIEIGSTKSKSTWGDDV